MSRIAFVNGRYLPQRAAMIHIEDRGYQLSDGVYEVLPVANSRVVDVEPHFARLDHSLRQLRIAWPGHRSALKFILSEIVKRNGIALGSVYCQVTRGVVPREHKFPARARSSLVVTGKKQQPPGPRLVEKGAVVIFLPDLRWKRRDIKSISLLPNVLAKQQAFEAEAFEAWFVGDDNFVTEGSSTNAWIVTDKGEIVTRAPGPEILAGITRMVILEIARRAGFSVSERLFTKDEALAASEAFMTSTTTYVLPVTKIDGQPVGAGKPGPVTAKLRQLYLEHIARQSGSKATI